jgi:HNH endonuclease
MRRISSLPTAELEAIRERFWSKVDVSGGGGACWPWTAAINHERGGYGQFKLGLPEKKTIRCNRMAWILARGDIEDGLHVLHSCDNPRCCNPAHLFVGSNLDNIKDRVAKHRSNPKRVLSNRQVVEIIVNFGVVNMKTLANVYGVSYSLIDSILMEKKRLPPCVA